MDISDRTFYSATSTKKDWRDVVSELSCKLEKGSGNLGIIYLSEDLLVSLKNIIKELKIETSCHNWLGAGGYGVLSNFGEFYGETSATVLLLDLPEESFKIFSGNENIGLAIKEGETDWLKRAHMPLAITHADPSQPTTMGAIKNLARETNSYLIGGLTAASGESPHISDQSGKAISGALLSPETCEILTGLSQGCSPISETLTITKSQRNIILELDGRPAFDVLLDVTGKEFLDNLQKMGGTIFVAFPIPGSDKADYTVRNLVGLDPQNKVIAISENISDGDKLLFCRRDKESAVKDMYRMSEDLKRRIGEKQIRGGIYISCAARGPNQFPDSARELDIITETLGDFPLAGFYANGEISRDEIYAYTGVLAVFL